MSGGQNHLARQSKRGQKTRLTEKKRWEDTRVWTGLEFAKSQRAAESREKRRELVVKSSVEPQRPTQVRDRWR